MAVNMDDGEIEAAHRNGDENEEEQSKKKEKEESERTKMKLALEQEKKRSLLLERQLMAARAMVENTIARCDEKVKEMSTKVIQSRSIGTDDINARTAAKKVERLTRHHQKHLPKSKQRKA